MLLGACTQAQTPAEPMMTPVTVEEAPDVETQPAKAECSIVISELMASNKATLCDSSGSFPDWLELYNAGDQPQRLEGMALSDGNNQWIFPDRTMEPGEYTVVLCGKDASGELCADFALGADGESVTLSLPDGTKADSFCYTGAESDVSFVRDENGEAVPCELPSPGYENSEEGYAEFAAARETPALCINEVCVFNRSYGDKDGEFRDWVELKNTGDETIRLWDWYLSDSGSQRMKYRLPEKHLRPGERILILCDEDGETGFALNNGGDELFLTAEDGTLGDYVLLRNIPAAYSYGRREGENGFFLFETPTPGKENSGASARLISAVPESGCRGGVYDNGETVTVELSAPGEIYYTLDGSHPDSSSLRYSGGISIKRTSVLRAVSIEKDKLPSLTLDLSFIMNEKHSLPVASIVADPEDLFGRKQGIYANPLEDWERSAHVSFFAGEDSFEADCGIKMHGETSRVRQEKKTYKLNFREIYGGTVESDLFGNGVTEFSSLLMRSAQESSFSTQMRDVVLQKLIGECTDALPRQDTRYCILYINGEYWGIYAFREAHSPEHFAGHFGYDADEVDSWKKEWDFHSEFEEIYRFIQYNDMAKDENYARAIEHIDTEALAAWIIIEAYSGNVDLTAPNVRYYYSRADGVLHYALVDLDLGFFKQGNFMNPFKSGESFSELPIALCRNEQFRQLLAQRLSEYLHGPLKKENVQRVIAETAAELRPEIERDGERWGYSPAQWEREIQFYMLEFTDKYAGVDYARHIANSAKSFLQLDQEQFQQLFGDIGETE